MIEFLKQLPHLEPYGTPVYFIYLIGALLPIFVGLFFKKRFPVYEALVSLAFIVLILDGLPWDLLSDLPSGRDDYRDARCDPQRI